MRPADRKNASGIDAAARQREIEDALKADFNQAAVVSPNMDPERLQQITAAFEGKPPPPLSPKIETPVPKSNSFTSARVDSTVDPSARKKEIEEALKADFGAAKTVNRQKEIEAVFEGRLPVQAKRGVSPVHDPFAVNSLPSAPPASVDDVLKAEMKAVEALKSTQDPSIKAAEEALLGPKILSIQDILKAEMEAANQLKKTSGVSNGAPVTPVSSQYQGVAPKSEESTKGKSKPEKKIEMAATSHDEEKKPKKKRKRNRNKNKNKSSEGGVNESDTSSINGSIKKEDL